METLLRHAEAQCALPPPAPPRVPKLGGGLLPSPTLNAPGHLGTREILGSDSQTSTLEGEGVSLFPALLTGWQEC